MTKQFVLATHNQHKVAELQEILKAALPNFADGSAELVAYDGPEPVEDGTTFVENALIKARAAFMHTGLPSIADDSGLAVDILGGSPGIFSARWSGAKDDAANRKLLLSQLRDVRPEHRDGAFICAMALVDSHGEEHCTGVWSGKVALAEVGENGFGYDSIFIPKGESLTAAQLPPDEKNAMSHRARAAKQLVSVLASRL
jgi:XTP/dITP diphosphohydrolase